MQIFSSKRFCTLLPGDVILTGTPPGVGVFAKPPQFLKVSIFCSFLSFIDNKSVIVKPYSLERRRGRVRSGKHWNHPKLSDMKENVHNILDRYKE